MKNYNFIADLLFFFSADLPRDIEKKDNKRSKIEKSLGKLRSYLQEQLSFSKNEKRQRRHEFMPKVIIKPLATLFKKILRKKNTPLIPFNVEKRPKQS